jgi:hypothetical protein
MVDVTLGLQRLSDAGTKEELLDALRDLRDSAFDHPQTWKALTAETLLQALAESLEDSPSEDARLQPASRLLADTFKKVLRPG